jgi:hypothetical protein
LARNVAWLDLGPVSDQLARRIETLYCVDISGLHHGIDTRALEKSYSNIGPNVVRRFGQLLHVPESFALVREVVEHADIIRKPISKGRTKLIRFEKRANGTVFVVRQRYDEAGEFAFFDMWIGTAKRLPQ